MVKSSVLSAITVLSLVAASAVHAQTTAAVPTTKTPIELGIDAAASFGLDDPNMTTIAIPQPEIRAGFFVSPHISIEPIFGLDYTHLSSGGDSYNETDYSAVVGVLYHFTTDRHVRQFYVRPFGGMVGYSGSGDSQTQGLLGAGFGVKFPISGRISSRFEANYSHHFSSGDVGSSNAIGLMAGLSFFTR